MQLWLLILFTCGLVLEFYLRLKKANALKSTEFREACVFAALFGTPMLIITILQSATQDNSNLLFGSVLFIALVATMLLRKWFVPKVTLIEVLTHTVTFWYLTYVTITSLNLSPEKITAASLNAFPLLIALPLIFAGTGGILYALGTKKTLKRGLRGLLISWNTLALLILLIATQAHFVLQNYNTYSEMHKHILFFFLGMFSLQVIINAEVLLGGNSKTKKDKEEYLTFMSGRLITKKPKKKHIITTLSALLLIFAINSTFSLIEPYALILLVSLGAEVWANQIQNHKRRLKTN